MRSLISITFIAILLLAGCGGGGTPVVDPPDNGGYTPPDPGLTWHLASAAPGDLPATCDIKMSALSTTAWRLHLPDEVLAHIDNVRIESDGLLIRKGDDAYYSHDIFAGTDKPYRYFNAYIYDDHTEAVIRYPDGSGGAVEVTYAVTQ